MSSDVKSGQSNLPIKYYICMTEKPTEYSFVGLLTVLCDEGICNEAANMSKLADDSKIFVIMMNIRSLKCKYHIFWPSILTLDLTFC